MATRIEIDPSALFLIWAGDGAISEDKPGIFSVRNMGQAYFAGNLRPEVARTAVQNPQYSNTAIAETDPVVMPSGAAIRVNVSMSYENSGYRTTQLTGSPSCQVWLQYAYGTNNPSWTTLTTLPVVGSIKNTPSGSGFQSTISLRNALTFTHRDTRGGTFRYRATIMFADSSWPVTIGSSRGKQRLGLQVVSLN